MNLILKREVNVYVTEHEPTSFLLTIQLFVSSRRVNIQLDSKYGLVMAEPYSRKNRYRGTFSERDSDAPYSI